MNGYMIKPDPNIPKGQVKVSCARCLNSWYEVFKKQLIYDVCDTCKKPDDQIIVTS